MFGAVERPTVGAMDEQLRILGRERQADLDREARRFALADQVQRDRVVRVRLRPWLFGRVASMLSISGRPHTSGKAAGQPGGSSSS